MVIDNWETLILGKIARFQKKNIRMTKYDATPLAERARMIKEIKLLKIFYKKLIELEHIYI